MGLVLGVGGVFTCSCWVWSRGDWPTGHGQLILGARQLGSHWELHARRGSRRRTHQRAKASYIMKLISLASAAACASAFTAPISARGTLSHSAAVSSTALRSTRRDPITGKIYVGEPEPLEELADLVGGLLGGLGRVADGLLGPAPVPIPIPVEDEREQQAPDNGQMPPRDPYKYPGTY